MIAPDVAMTWLQAALWMLAVLSVAFLVSWLATDLAHTPRGAYVFVLAVVTAAVTGGYLAWAGISPGRWIAHRAVWGVVGGIVVALPVARGITRVRATRPAGDASAATLAWEGVVYGIAEGVLLSALPALIAWHAADSAGWTATVPGTVAAWAVALVASVAVIVIHHLGYWDYRNRQVIPVAAGCGLLTIAFLATGSVLAPVIGHVAMHIAGIEHGVELPPHVRSATATR
ncbi:MAG TPA: hypothetical protein VK891_06525 [Euzebyales bacterium]|nr:hypothetical protein [Euzebyales bacterium]